MKLNFAKVAPNVLGEVQFGAGIITSSFNPAEVDIEEAISNIIAATDGGVNAYAKPSFLNLMDGIDNTVQVKEGIDIDMWDCGISGTFKTVSAATIKMLLAAADVTDGKITPRNYVTEADFNDIWLVADYSKGTTASSEGFIAVHLMNALSQDGFSWQTTNKGKGSFTANFKGYATLENIDLVPFEVYISESEAA
jgi:hypothetical protein